MKKLPFAWIALGGSLLLVAVLLRGGAADPGAPYSLPLLTMLVINEFGFFLSAAGTYIAGSDVRRNGPRLATVSVLIGCILLLAVFTWLGFSLWPDAVSPA